MTSDNTLHPTPFPVDNRSYCIWDTDLVQKTGEFLENFSSGYYRFLSEALLEGAASGDHSAAALAVRIAYHHGLESLFYFLVAFLQAPRAMMAWISLCSTEVLRKLVAEIGTGNARILNPHGFRTVSWETLATLVHASLREREPHHHTRLVSGLAQTWTVLALDFLDPWFIKERNQMAHGLNVRSRGGSLTISKGESTIQLGGEYGTRMLEVLHVGSLATGGRVHHMMASRSLTWSLKALAHRLELITVSLHNLVAAAKVWNGTGSTARFIWPREEDASDVHQFEEATLRSLVETVGLE